MLSTRVVSRLTLVPVFGAGVFLFGSVAGAECFQLKGCIKGYCCYLHVDWSEPPGVEINLTQPIKKGSVDLC